MRCLFILLLGLSLCGSPVASAKPFQFSLRCALTVMLVSGVGTGVLTPGGKWATSATRGQYLLRQPVDLGEEALTVSRYEDLANFALRQPAYGDDVLKILGIRRWLKFYQAKDEKFAAELKAQAIPVDTDEKFLQFIGCGFNFKTQSVSYSYAPWYFDRRRAVAHLYAKIIVDEVKIDNAAGINNNSDLVDSLYYSSLSLPQ